MSDPQIPTNPIRILHAVGCPGEGGVLDLCECRPVVTTAPKPAPAEAAEAALAEERACHDCKEFREMLSAKLRAAERELAEARDRIDALTIVAAHVQRVEKDRDWYRSVVESARGKSE